MRGKLFKEENIWLKKQLIFQKKTYFDVFCIKGIQIGLEVKHTKMLTVASSLFFSSRRDPRLKEGGVENL